MKKLLVLLMFVAICATAFSQSISHIENKNHFYRIYNEKNVEVKAVGDYVGTLVGHGSKFFIVVKNGFYDLYCMTCKVTSINRFPLQWAILFPFRATPSS